MRNVLTVLIRGEREEREERGMVRKRERERECKRRESSSKGDRERQGATKVLVKERRESVKKSVYENETGSVC